MFACLFGFSLNICFLGLVSFCVFLCDCLLEIRVIYKTKLLEVLNRLTWNRTVTEWPYELLCIWFLCSTLSSGLNSIAAVLLQDVLRVFCVGRITSETIATNASKIIGNQTADILRKNSSMLHVTKNSATQ